MVILEIAATECKFYHRRFSQRRLLRGRRPLYGHL
jgi:hypothetical protein